MEKQGMDGAGGFFRAGLLALFFLFFPLCLVPAQMDAAGAGQLELMEVLAVFSPENPVVNKSLTITILADHPVPSEVVVRQPRFPSSLMLERVRTEARQIKRPGMFDESLPPPEPERWTAVEFLFAPLSAGAVIIEPIEIRAPGKKAFTGTIRISVLNDRRAVSRGNPVFRWENPPVSIEAGKEKELVLVLSGWDPKRPPPQRFLDGRGPRNAIIEELPFTDPGAGGIIRYRYRIIPLAAEASGEELLVLEAFPVPAEGYTLEFPRLSLKVIKPRNVPPEPVKEQTVLPEEAAAGELSPQKSETAFPDFQDSGGGKIFPPFKAEYAKILKEIKLLWEEENYTEALAKIRRGERESFAGPSFTPLRREMEKSLGLSGTEDENWLFWKIPLAFVLSALVLTAGFRRFCVTSGRLKGYKGIILLIAVITLSGLFFFGGPGGRSLKSGGGKKAVLKNTPAYRVPDDKGTVDAVFDEGQPVFIRSGRGEWLYAESSGGGAGWIHSKAAVPY